MKPKSIKITYWILLALLCLSMAGDAYGGITSQPAGVEGLKHLGYPIYLLPFFGWLKALGIVALLQPKWTGIKEWVFAGMAFIFIGAEVSHISVNDSIALKIGPIVALAILALVYVFWNKYEKVKDLK